MEIELSLLVCPRKMERANWCLVQRMSRRFSSTLKKTIGFVFSSNSAKKSFIINMDMSGLFLKDCYDDFKQLKRILSKTFIHLNQTFSLRSTIKEKRRNLWLKVSLEELKFGGWCLLQSLWIFLWLIEDEDINSPFASRDVSSLVKKRGIKSQS